MKIQVDIYSGFLGAGKTTLIKKLLTEKAYGKNTVIIENEFGEVGIDGQILKESNIEVKEINSGCICCQVSGNFGEAVLEVINRYKPDNIIIEPSGVAKLSEVLSVLKKINVDEKLEVRNIFTLIDIRNYFSYLMNFKEFYENQIKKANKIILSRSQLATEEMIKNTIDSIKTINSKAEIIYNSWDTLKAKDFFSEIDISYKQKISTTKEHINGMVKKEANHNAKEVFESYPIDISKNINIQEIKRKFEMISKNDDYGKIIRAKGVIVGEDGLYYQFDYVPNEFKSRIIRWSNIKVVSIIGSQLNKKELTKLFE